MSSPKKGGLKGGHIAAVTPQKSPIFSLAQQKSPLFSLAQQKSPIFSLATQKSPTSFPPHSPSAKQPNFQGIKSSITHSNNPVKSPIKSTGKQCIADALELQFRGSKKEDSSLDLISNDVQRILQESIDFVSARNSSNALLVNVQKKCVDISSVKLTTFSSSNALKLGGAKMIDDRSRPQPSLQNSSQLQQNVNVSPSKSGSDDQLPEPKLSFYDVEKIGLNWVSQARVGAGLYNVGNTCFLNATLQCLAYTPALYNYLLTEGHRKKCGIQGFCIICALEETIDAMFQGAQGVRPHRLIANIKVFAKSLSIGRQEDAHEFLRFVVEAMRKSALHGQNLKTLDMYSQETTIASRLFGGFYRSRVTCSNCKHPSSVYDPFMDIPLDLKNVDSLDGALKLFTKPESLDSPNNLYNCDRCKKMCSAKKQVTVHKPPNILTFQLKRFLFNSFASFSKIDKPVAYPEILDFAPFVSPEVRPHKLQYKLYGVLVHMGSSCHSGHYFSYIRNSNQLWYRMDDCSVQSVSLQQAMNQRAYLLFYTRIPDAAPNNKPSTLVSQLKQPIGPVNVPRDFQLGPNQGPGNVPRDSQLAPVKSFKIPPIKPSVTGNGPSLLPPSPAQKPKIGLQQKPIFTPRVLNPGVLRTPIKVTVAPATTVKPALVDYPSESDEEENEEEEKKKRGFVESFVAVNPVVLHSSTETSQQPPKSDAAEQPAIEKDSAFELKKVAEVEEVLKGNPPLSDLETSLFQTAIMGTPALPESSSDTAAVPTSPKRKTSKSSRESSSEPNKDLLEANFAVESPKKSSSRESSKELQKSSSRESSKELQKSSSRGSSKELQQELLGAKIVAVSPKPRKEKSSRESSSEKQNGVADVREKAKEEKPDSRKSEESSPTKKRNKKRKNKKKRDAASPVSSSSSVPSVVWVEKNAVECHSDPLANAKMPLGTSEPQSEPIRNGRNFPSPQKNPHDSNVKAWNGGQSILDKEDQIDKQESRKRTWESTRDEEFDAGRQPKKHNQLRSSFSHGNGFQQHQNRQNSNADYRKNYRPHKSASTRYNR